MRSLLFRVLIVCLMCTTLSCADDAAFRPKTVIRKAFPAIKNAQHVGAADANDEIVEEDELVLGVEINGVARAYPINMLKGPQREIINDKLGQTSIAATW